MTFGCHGSSHYPVSGSPAILFSVAFSRAALRDRRATEAAHAESEGEQDAAGADDEHEVKTGVLVEAPGELPLPPLSSCVCTVPPGLL
jgi:hypothetical protein